MKTPISRFVLVSLLLVSSTAWAGIIAPLRLAELVGSSDLIVIASVATIDNTGDVSLTINGITVPATTHVARLVIDHTLKGPSDPTTVECSFVMPRVPIGYGLLTGGAYRLVFLKQDAGRWVFTNPSYPSLPAVPSRSVVGRTDFARVVAALGNVLDSPAVDAVEKRQIIGHLSRAGLPEAIAELRRTVKNSDETVRLSATGALLAHGGIDSLFAAEAALMNPSPAVPEDVLQDVRVGIRAVTDTGAIPALGRLLTAGAPETRLAAAAALRANRTAAAIPHLVTALNDTDAEVRYTAVIGLAEATKDSAHGPSRTRFLADEATYLSYWKGWAQKR